MSPYELQEFLRERELSQIAFARMLGVHKTTVWRWLRRGPDDAPLPAWLGIVVRCLRADRA